VIQRQLTLGQLIAAELIVTVVVSGFSKFGKQLETFYDLNAAVDKLGYLTDLPVEKSGSDPLPYAQRGAKVNLHGVTFTYPTGNTVLHHIDLNVPSNARVAITGQGKSTLLDIVFGLRTPSEGILEVDDHDLRQLRIDEVRSQIALVRDVEVFHGTIAENLRLCDATISSADIRAALKAVGLLQDVQDLPEGIETQLKTGGLPLSPSQGIRLILARALLQRPRLLLIDEALDQIESRDEREQLAKMLLDPVNPWTVIVVSGKPEVIAHCDRVYDLRNGRLTAESKEFPR
jgi:ABC-type bacteriocin/lantibiotic exporter with double-glycine peptidase domain